LQLFECDGKRLLKEWRIAVPRGLLLTSADGLSDALSQLGGKAVLKIQVPVGKRGKAGGIRLISSIDEGKDFFKQWAGKRHGGFEVESILAEEPLKISKEFYMSVVLNAREGNFCFIFSAEGGVDIEETSRQHADKVLKVSLDPAVSVKEFHFRNILLEHGYTGPLLLSLSNIAANLYKGFGTVNALLAEINPLVLLEDGSVMAADAKIEIDDSARFRLGNKNFVEVKADELEREAKDIGVTYIKLDDGNVAIIASGAGLSMNTMDLIYEAGMKPANFLETGGGITRELVRRSVHLVLKNEGARAVIVNLYGGVNSLLEAAIGIVAGVKELKRPVPLVVKALGNQQEECWALLEEHNIPVIKSHRTEDAVAYIQKQLEVATA
jgi:succinyl-CoA synthetase beta subunit